MGATINEVKLLATGIKQRLDDHVMDEDKRFDRIECDIKTLLDERQTRTSRLLSTWTPIVVSIALLAGGWVWGLARQEAKIADLENGRYENKGNISVLMKQMNDSLVLDATRDARYESIIEKLTAIQKRLDDMHRQRVVP